VTFGYEFEADSRRDFARLDFEAQESVLDDLDRLAAGGDLLPNRGLPAALEWDLDVTTPSGKYSIFLRVEYDRPRRLLHVIRVGFHLQPPP
jgi:hypothetical protein